jgi:hypothetical protein
MGMKIAKLHVPHMQPLIINNTETFHRNRGFVILARAETGCVSDSDI